MRGTPLLALVTVHGDLLGMPNMNSRSLYMVCGSEPVPCTYTCGLVHACSYCGNVLYCRAGSLLVPHVRLRRTAD